ncbi:unnamed protein product [Prunus armeniaca]
MSSLGRDHVVRISEPVQISGATRKRSKSAIALSLSTPHFIETACRNRTLSSFPLKLRTIHKGTRAVGDVIKSLGEKHSPVPRHGGSVKGLDNEAYGVHMNGYVEKDGKKFLWIAKRKPPDLDEITWAFPDPEIDGFTSHVPKLDGSGAL